MAQSNNQNGDRLDRIEFTLLNLASASVRHDNEFSRVNATLDRLAEQQQDDGALFLFWESVGAIFWIERLKEWMQLTFPNLHSVRKENFRTLVAEVKQTTKKP